jgi:hypothetical protein
MIFLEYELEAMNRLAAGEFEILGSLRRQLALAEPLKRTFTGAGFYLDLSLPKDVPLVNTPKRRLIVDGVNADLTGVTDGVGFVLFVDLGKVSMLEGFTYDGAWPKDVHVERWWYDHEFRDYGFLTR